VPLSVPSNLLQLSSDSRDHDICVLLSLYILFEAPLHLLPALLGSLLEGCGCGKRVAAVGHGVVGSGLEGRVGPGVKGGVGDIGRGEGNVALQ